MSNNIKKILLYRLVFIIIAVIIVCLLINIFQADKFTNKEVAPNINVNVLMEDAFSDLLLNNVNSDYFNKNVNYADIEFINEDNYNIIKKIYDETDFFGNFEKGDTSEYSFYLEKYLELIEDDRTVDERNSKDVQWGEYTSKNVTLYSSYLFPISNKNDEDINKYKYYFFDIDNDGAPELSIQTEMYLFTYDYDETTDKIKLWQGPAANRSILGSQKVSYMLGLSEAHFGFIKLAQDGGHEMKLQFYIGGCYYNEQNQPEYHYMISIPEYNAMPMGTFGNLENQLYYHDITESYYFMVTEKQYNELTSKFYKSLKKSEENIKDVTFSYEELFETP